VKWQYESSRDKAAIVGVPIRDTVKEVKDNGFVERTIKRDKLWLTQTPQAFSASLIKEPIKGLMQTIFSAPMTPHLSSGWE